MRSLSRLQSKTASERAPRRMERLSVLPVFLGLEGRPVVLAGGSEAAAWKAELLLAAGAVVQLYAPDDTMDAAMRALLMREPRLVHHDRPWSTECLSGAALAVADTSSDGEAQAFQCAARAASVPFNVIDRPAYCGFQFGSIVNRSPVVVGISTNGVAPILGQAIRRRIETLLPPSLAAWGALAGRLRTEVLARFAPGAARRAFWERFVDRAFAGPPEADAGQHLLSAPATSQPNTGRVTLVGAGPGDAELLTLKAVRALQAADVILFDDLVSDDVLELARREAKRMLVGKRGGRESCRQEDINAMMVNFARAGKNVVRLKSGDPMIFGRAGEEIARLQEEGIAVEIVPGITSALAMAARLKVSLTHRDCAQSVRFVTGHARDGLLPETVDWRAAADPAQTMIFYMGGRTASALSQRLMAHGLAPETPAVVMRAIARAEECHRITTLAGLPDAVGRHRLRRTFRGDHFPPWRRGDPRLTL
jgi:uroporphyrin-III C-methyltransferase / precorrin-2 dehydrogenase / sirohydrochlorin ferrochelatase